MGKISQRLLSAFAALAPEFDPMQNAGQAAGLGD
jgi:hypothetical protein